MIGFIAADAVNGDYKLNPFNFRHFNCSLIAARVNGLQIPTKGYRPYFEKKIVRRELRALYDNNGVIDPSYESGCNLDAEDFTGSYTLFSFDLTSDKCNGFHLHENTTGIIDLEILFFKKWLDTLEILKEVRGNKK